MHVRVELERKALPRAVVPRRHLPTLARVRSEDVPMPILDDEHCRGDPLYLAVHGGEGDAMARGGVAECPAVLLVPLGERGGDGHDVLLRKDRRRLGAAWHVAPLHERGGRRQLDLRGGRDATRGNARGDHAGLGVRRLLRPRLHLLAQERLHTLRRLEREPL
eukprot:CAMPEP_0182857070 /NCGR_PEP_ID=MMETSP0034_2-20130328/2832_1 /TAXON_ID=156128 /ORGANISM="Nephroselmis pyriformis, Strain CCMP717" /LENGTH=162 /DNA_ID=CAMNT_0024988263 /DNA_START=206 /DNA_END=694 /DNA_ORIENTATION=+